MTMFSMWAGRADDRGRSLAAAPECVAALTYLQGPASFPDEDKDRCVVLVFEEHLGDVFNATTAEVRMTVETAVVLRDALTELIGRIERDVLLADDDYDDDGA